MCLAPYCSQHSRGKVLCLQFVPFNIKLAIISRDLKASHVDKCNSYTAEFQIMLITYVEKNGNQTFFTNWSLSHLCSCNFPTHNLMWNITFWKVVFVHFIHNFQTQISMLKNCVNYGSDHGNSHTSACNSHHLLKSEKSDSKNRYTMCRLCRWKLTHNAIPPERHAVQESSEKQ